MDFGGHGGKEEGVAAPGAEDRLEKYLVLVVVRGSIAYQTIMIDLNSCEAICWQPE
jgi:hypothetical protein